MPFMRTPDRTELWLRPIRPTDKPGIAGVLGKLSLETIHRRYLATKKRFSPAELRYLTEVDGVDHYAVVAIDARVGRAGRRLLRLLHTAMHLAHVHRGTAVLRCRALPECHARGLLPRHCRDSTGPHRGG